MVSPLGHPPNQLGYGTTLLVYAHPFLFDKKVLAAFVGNLPRTIISAKADAIHNFNKLIPALLQGSF
jgi:hypothetical protein